jgi:L-iditol 2-dehydrogenase
VTSRLAYTVPDEISDNAAALLEPLSVGIWANRKAGTQVGTSLLIAGAGPIGLVTTQVARAAGAGRSP